MWGTIGRVGLVLLLIAGCGPPLRPALAPPAGSRIVVREFSISDVAEIHYGASYQGLGMLLAEDIAGQLRRRGEMANAIPAGAAPQGDLIVSGEITRIDGGSRVLRAMINMGAGGATLGARGQVTNGDGTKVRRFSDERWTKGPSPFTFWWKFGGSDE